MFLFVLLLSRNPDNLELILITMVICFMSVWYVSKSYKVPVLCEMGNGIVWNGMDYDNV